MTVSIVASFDLRQQDFTPRFLGMKSCWLFLAERDKKGKHYGCLRMRRKAVPVHIPLKTFATADVTMVVIIRNILFTTFLVLFIVTLVTTNMAETFPPFLTDIAIVMWAVLPACLLIAWAFNKSSARITRFQFALTLLIGALVAPILALFVEEHVSIWIDQGFSPAQTLFDVPWGSLFFYSLCTPIIEEALKALGVLVVLRRMHTADAAVLLGLVSGCGFATFEMSIYLLGQGNWSTIALSRMGVVVVHAVATGLVGCGISFLRMKTIARRVMGGGIIATAICIHAVFNFMNIIFIPLHLDQPLIVLGVPLTAIFFLNLSFAFILIIGMMMVLSILSHDQDSG